MFVFFLFFCLEFQMIRFVIIAFTPIFLIEITFVLPPPPHRTTEPKELEAEAASHPRSFQTSSERSFSGIAQDFSDEDVRGGRMMAFRWRIYWNIFGLWYLFANIHRNFVLLPPPPPQDDNDVLLPDVAIPRSSVWSPAEATQTLRQSSGGGGVIIELIRAPCNCLFEEIDNNWN